MTISIRPCVDADMQGLLALADAAVPFDHAGNLLWLQARQAFDETSAQRRHYVAEAASGAMVGYGAIEQQDADPRRFRIYIVPQRFGSGIEDLLYTRLLQDLRELDAQVVWLREHHTDASLLAFAQQHGFVETQMIWDLRFDFPEGADAARARTGPPAPELPVGLTTLEQERRARPDALTRLFALCDTLVARARRPPLAESGFTRWLAQPDLAPDAFVIVTHRDSYVGLHALKETERPQEALQEFAGLTDSALIAAAGGMLRGWLLAYAQRRQYQRITAYAPAHDSSLLAFDEAIGYRRVFAYVTLEKRLDRDR